MLTVGSLTLIAREKYRKQLSPKSPVVRSMAASTFMNKSVCINNLLTVSTGMINV